MPNGVLISRGVIDRNAYVDLRDGWRLRVVSGRPTVHLTGPVTQNPDGSLGVGGEMTSDGTYELAIYTVNGGGPNSELVTVSFSMVALIRGGNTIPLPRPARHIFSWQTRPHHVRLVFLTRLSTVEHNMAIVAARNWQTLDLITQQIRGDVALCKRGKDFYCEWVPTELAIRPERPVVVDGALEWRPAR